MNDRSEAKLYPSINKALAACRLHVRERLTMRVGQEKTRTPDHVAWRWDGPRIDLLAVEAKVGSRTADAALALAQATEYQAGIPYVFASAETAVADLGYLERVLAHLHLGYIRARRCQRGVARIESEPGESPFLEPTIHAENVARIRLLHLWRPKVIRGAEKHRGHDQRPDFWVATVKNRWQLCGHVRLGSTHTTISLLAENKWLGTRFCERAQPTKVAHVLRELQQATGRDAQLVCRERVSKAQRARYMGVHFIWSAHQSEHALGAALMDARKLADKNWHGPNFEVRGACQVG